MTTSGRKKPDSKDVAIRTEKAQVSWEDMMDTVKATVAPEATPAEFAVFVHMAKRAGLDPLARQIYCVSRYDSKTDKDKATIQVSIDGARLVAQRSGQYGGQTKTEWCGADGLWRDVWLKDVPPSASRVGVWRTGFKEPLYATAIWSEYVQKYKDRKTGQMVVTTMWRKMPTLMLAKVAEMLALRRSFPMELGGLYTAEEMAQSENPESEVVIPEQSAPTIVPADEPETAPVMGPVPDFPVKNTDGKAGKDINEKFGAMSLLTEYLEKSKKSGFTPSPDLAESIGKLTLQDSLESIKAVHGQFETALSLYKMELIQAFRGEVEKLNMDTLSDEQKGFVDNVEKATIDAIYTALLKVKKQNGGR